MRSATGEQVLEVVAGQRCSGVPHSLRNVVSLMLLGESEDVVRQVFGKTSVEAFNYKVAENLRDGRLTHGGRSALRRTQRAVDAVLADAPLTNEQRDHLLRLQTELLVGAHV